MSRGPLVTIVVPTYQRGAVLEEALRSALAQTYERIEVLVEDDGSRDGTEAIVAGLRDERVRYAWAPNVGRPAPVRNRAIRRARGELLAFLDSDDVWEREKLHRQVEALAAEPELLGVTCNAHYLPARNRPVLRLSHDVRPSFEENLVDNRILNSGVVVRREVFDQVGLLDESPELRAVEDYDLWLRILLHRDRSILVLAAPLFRYRCDAADAISVYGAQELERIRRVFARLEPERPQAVRAALRARELRVRRGALRDGLRNGTLSMAEWLRAVEVPLRRRIRLAAKAVIFGRRTV